MNWITKALKFGEKIKKIIKKRPSKEEIEVHELTHFPFKNWCEICVKAKANTPGHFKRNPDSEGRIPRLSMDYMFLPIEDSDHITPILVINPPFKSFSIVFNTFLQTSG